MCGLYGSITNPKIQHSEKQNQQRINIITGLAVYMEKRGDHSSGIAISVDDKITYSKTLLKASEFVNNVVYKRMLSKNPTIILGHTRYASSGVISEENAHPFIYGNIIGCHNGHVTNNDDIMEDSNVDSQAIFYLLNKNKNDFKKTFAQLDGEFAIEWINTQSPNEVHLAKKTNPLAIAFVKSLDCWFWASTYTALHSVLYSVYGNEGYFIIEAGDNTYYNITPNLKMSQKIVEFGTDPIKKELVINIYPKTTSTSNTARNSADYAIYKDAIFIQKRLKKIRRYFNRVGGMLCYECSRSIDGAYVFYWDSSFKSIRCQVCVFRSKKSNTEKIIYWNNFEKVAMGNPKLKTMIEEMRRIAKKEEFGIKDTDPLEHSTLIGIIKDNTGVSKTTKEILEEIQLNKIITN
jgi:glucosamine 6-phosphate synthetase-like amidotransferase/phosphosugar isomerase protein